MEEQSKKVMLPLFSKPVYYTKLNNIKKDFLNNIKFLETKEKSGLLSENLNILETEDFFDIKAKIEQELNFYLYKILRMSKKIKAKIAGSWVVLHKNELHKAPPHTHGNSVLSGCFYLKAPKNCGRLYFLDQQSINLSRAIPFSITPTFDQENIYNANAWPIEVEENLLIFFPSDLAHGTEANQSGEERYCLAFDILFEGDFHGPPFNKKIYKISIESEN